MHENKNSNMYPVYSMMFYKFITNEILILLIILHDIRKNIHIFALLREGRWHH